MAVLWEKQTGGVHYEVRTAGGSLRLYTNGVLHTQYNPKRRWTGSVWDLLTMTTLLRPPQQIRRVLVLGVGGGAAIRQLLQFFPEAQITGVELNPVHVQVAKRFFGLRDAGVELVCANAVTYLALYDGAPFDLIIDDLFGDRDGIPCRAVTADADWLDLLATHLAPGGQLTINFAGSSDAGRAPWRDVFGPRFPAVLSLSTPGCENRVLGFLPAAATVADLQRALAAQPDPARQAPRFRARALAPGR